jgi:histidinol-phosphatase (PHP family)
MPYFSYHGGHSGQFCRHAKGDLRAVVERAVELGFTHYGLSEHSPRYRNVDRFPDEVDLTPDDLVSTFQSYVASAKALRDEYAESIELLVGFETERLPPEDWYERMTELRAATGADYIVGSVHDVRGICIDYSPDHTTKAAEALGGVEPMQLCYFDQLADLVSRLAPEVVGHIDLIRKFDGQSASFSPGVMARIEMTLEAVRQVKGVLDVNAGAHRRGLSPVYPLPEILALARRMGIRVTLGDDSHGAHDVGVGLDACLQCIANAGYDEVHYLTRSEGEVRWLGAPLSEVRTGRQLTAGR